MRSTISSGEAIIQACPELTVVTGADWQFYTSSRLLVGFEVCSRQHL